MKRFKISELIVKFPVDEQEQLNVPEGNNCNQVTLLECPNGVTRVDGCSFTRLPDDTCRQVTLLNCANGVTRIECEVTLDRAPCRQVTLLECANGITVQQCDGRSLIPHCRQVTFLECAVTNAGAAATPGTHYGPRCQCECRTDRNCTKTDPTTLETCPTANCGICTDNTPQCTDATDDCGACTHGTDEAALFVVTREVDRMPLESLTVLKAQLSEIMVRAEEAEKQYKPSTIQDLDAAELRLKEALAEVEKMRAEMKSKPK